METLFDNKTLAEVVEEIKTTPRPEKSISERLREAVAQHDQTQCIVAIVDEIERLRDGKVSASTILDTVSFVWQNAPDFFAAYDPDRKIEEDKSAWTQDYFDEQLRYLRRNFCLERLRHLVMVCAALHGKNTTTPRPEKSISERLCEAVAQHEQTQCIVAIVDEIERLRDRKVSANTILDTVSFVWRNAPDFFEAYDPDRKIEEDKSAWTQEDYFDEQLRYLRRNFCLERLCHLVMVCDARQQPPSGNNPTQGPGGTTPPPPPPPPPLSLGCIVAIVCCFVTIVIVIVACISLIIGALKYLINHIGGEEPQPPAPTEERQQEDAPPPPQASQPQVDEAVDTDNAVSEP